MTENSRWKTFEMECPEEQRTARFLTGWICVEGKFLLNSIHCDHPKLRETDNWDCNWSCLERIPSEEAS